MGKIYYTEDHEYVRVEGGIGTVGISNYAQNQLGDVVYVELPEEGAQFDQADEIGVIESVKVASELYAPVSGEVTEINEALSNSPDQINNDPEGDGWIYKIKLHDESELSALKDEEAYQDYIDNL